MLTKAIINNYEFEKQKASVFMTPLIKKMKECSKQPPLIPMSKKEMKQCGWDQIDVLLISGDAYIDHPSFGISLIGRVMLAAGYRVGIIAQPDWKNPKSLQELGTPRLACAVCSGNMDSMVNMYTAARRIRKKDAYSPGGKIEMRPARALTVYANLARGAFPGLPVILGGMEASMRRIAHYDYWQDKLKHSVLLDTKAEFLIYGMAEKTILNVLEKIKEDDYTYTNIPGTARLYGKNVTKSDKAEKQLSCYIELPSFDQLKKRDGSLTRCQKIIESEMNPFTGCGLYQMYGDRALIIEPPAEPLSSDEMDFVYELPFTGKPHPSYKEKIPAFEMIKDSLTAVRGCPGGCSFCGLGLHQGKLLTSRSKDSICREVKKLTESSFFRGTITDLGGPTANSYFNHGKDETICKTCKRSSCLYPKICSNYSASGNEFIELLSSVMSIPKVKHLFISSGIRLDLARQQPELMRQIIAKHVSGHMKVAPEHLSNKVLELMRKNTEQDFYDFIEIFRRESHKAGKEQYLIPYFISNFPGCDGKNMEIVSKYLKKNNWSPQQVQDFIPLPMTMATALYFEGTDNKGKPITVNRGLKERRFQLDLLKGKNSSFQREKKGNKKK